MLEVFKILFRNPGIARRMILHEAVSKMIDCIIVDGHEIPRFRVISAVDGCSKGTRCFFWGSRVDHVEIWNYAKAANRFNWLVSWAVFSDTNGVVGEDVSAGKPARAARRTEPRM